jgi:hypothetical protein
MTESFILCDDLLKASVDMMDKMNVDVTEEIDLKFGPELLDRMRSMSVVSLEEKKEMEARWGTTMDRKDPWGTTMDRKDPRFNKFFPPAFLKAFVKTLPVKGGAKLNIPDECEVDEEFVLRHGSVTSILTHPAVSDDNLQRTIDAEDDKKSVDNITDQIRAQSFLVANRKNYNPQFLLDYTKRLGFSNFGLMWVFANCRDLEMTLRENPEIQGGFYSLSRNCDLSAKFFLERKDEIDVTCVGNTPRCHELLADPTVLMKFLSSHNYTRYIRYLKAEFFRQHPSELQPSKINRYCGFSQNIELLHLFRPHRKHIPHWRQVIECPIPEIVSELITESASGYNLDLRGYFSNRALNLKFYKDHSHLIPLDYKLLSGHPDLPVWFILDESSSLDMMTVLEHNEQLPVWLMRRASLRLLGYL